MRSLPLLIRDGCHVDKAWGQAPYSTFPTGKAMVQGTQLVRCRDESPLHTDQLSASAGSRKKGGFFPPPLIAKTLKSSAGQEGGWETKMRNKNSGRKGLRSPWHRKPSVLDSNGSASLGQEPSPQWLILGAVWSRGSTARLGPCSFTGFLGKVIERSSTELNVSCQGAGARLRNASETE